MSPLRILSVLAQKPWFIHTTGCSGLVLLVWASSMLGVLPQLRSAKQAERQTRQAQQLRSQLTTLQQQREELVEDIVDMSSALVEQYSLLTANDESLLDLLVRLSDDHGLAFTAYTETDLHSAETETPATRLAALPTLHQPFLSSSSPNPTHAQWEPRGQRALVQLQGSYVELQQWLATLTRLANPIHVQSLRLSAIDPATDHFEAQVELHVFPLPQNLQANHFD